MPFDVQLYGPNDKPIGERFTFPALPYLGLVMVYEGAVWTVEAVQVVPAHPRSMAARDGDPMMVDARVIPTDGIHGKLPDAPAEWRARIEVALLSIQSRLNEIPPAR